MEDAPAIWAIADDYRDQYLLDNEELFREHVLEWIASGALTVLVDTTDYPVGAVLLTEQHPLHALLHFLIRPAALKPFLRHEIDKQVIDWLFSENPGIKKLKGRTTILDTTAIKLLMRVKFKQNGLFRNEALQQGKPVDVYAFELHRKFWERYRKMTGESP